MAEQLLTAKSAGKRLGEGLGVGASAVGAELITTFIPVNQWVKTGTKVAAGLIITGVSKERTGEIIGTGVLVDGMIDVVHGLVGLLGLSSKLPTGAFTTSQPAAQASNAIFV